MLKRTLFFTQAYHLSLKDKQMVVGKKEPKNTKTIPIEDIGYVVLEDQRTSITLPLLDELVKNNVAVIFCDRTHLPNAMLVNLNGHHTQNEIFRNQINVGIPLKKNLWKQTVEAKIKNQAALLKKLDKRHEHIEAFSKKKKVPTATLR